MSYQHSETFAVLKVIKDYDSNLTSFQWLSVLDYFLEAAIDPIATAAPHFLDNYYAKAVAGQFLKPAVNFSRGPKADLPCLLFNSLIATGKEKRKYQKAMVLNRGILFGCVQLYQKVINKFHAVHEAPTATLQEILIAREIEHSLGGEYVYASTIQTEYWYAKALWFKSLIVQKFTRLALMRAQHTYNEINHSLRLDDIVQIFLTYVNKAVERCDSRQGVLTTYIQTWFYSARAEVMAEAKLEMMSSSYSELLEQMQDTSTNFVSDLAALQELYMTAKKIDPEGYVRYTLGIPEQVSNTDHKKLKLFSLKSN